MWNARTAGKTQWRFGPVFHCRSGRPLFYSALLSALATAPSALGQDRASAGPAKVGAVCTAYLPRVDSWGPIGLAASNEVAECPAHEAVFAAPEPIGYELRNKDIALNGWCCPLPPDALTDEHRFALACREDEVATGSALAGTPEAVLAQPSTVRRKSVLRCTKINSARYMLGAPEQAVLFTDGGPDIFAETWLHFNAWIGRRFQATYRIAALPPALRIGIGRLRDESARAFCAAAQWGAVITGIRYHTGCPYIHRQLQFRGLEGDPPRGAPVQVFPDCIAVENPLSESPVCIRPPGTED